MAEYWHIQPGWEDSVRNYFAHTPEADMKLESAIPEKDFNVAGKGSAEVKNMLKRLGVDPVILRRIAVAAYEAEINVAAHSNGGKMTSFIYDELIRMIFVDKGPGIPDIEQAMVPGYSTADEMVRELGFGAGLGLPNIKKNSDALHIVSEAGGNTMLEFVIFFKND
jgi:serine/threonine-protein kinase RsbT